MNIFAVEIWDDERDRCTFYSVRWEDSTANETDKFLNRFDNDPTYEKATGELLSFVLEAVGDEHGAIDELFNRDENEVTGLPTRGNVRLGTFLYYYPRFPLRLYALKITESIVVLFSGGAKDGPTNQTSSLHVKWVEACGFARKIVEAIRDGSIIVDEQQRKLYSYDGSDEIIL